MARGVSSWPYGLSRRSGTAAVRAYPWAIKRTCYSCASPPTSLFARALATKTNRGVQTGHMPNSGASPTTLFSSRRGGVGPYTATAAQPLRNVYTGYTFYPFCSSSAGLGHVCAGTPYGLYRTVLHAATPTTCRIGRRGVAIAADGAHESRNSRRKWSRTKGGVVLALRWPCVVCCGWCSPSIHRLEGATAHVPARAHRAATTHSLAANARQPLALMQVQRTRRDEAQPPEINDILPAFPQGPTPGSSKRSE